MRAWQSRRLAALLKQPWWGQGCVPGAEGQDSGRSSLQTLAGPSLQPQNPNRAFTPYNEYITDVIISAIVYLSAFSLVIKLILSGKIKLGGEKKAKKEGA